MPEHKKTKPSVIATSQEQSPKALVFSTFNLSKHWVVRTFLVKSNLLNTCLVVKNL